MTYLVKQFCQDAFGKTMRVSMGGKEINLPCPFHGDHKKWHFYVNVTSGLYFCFRCEERGNFWKLLLRVAAENPDLKPSDYVIGEDEPQLGAFSYAVPPRSCAQTYSLQFPEGYHPVWSNFPGHEVARKAALDYLNGRGLSLVDARFFEIGFAPSGRLGRRVIVPVRSPDKRLVGWVARDITGEKPLKILSSSDKEVSVKDYVFSLDKAKGVCAEVVVVEGVFDAMRHGAHFLALLGRVATERQVAALIAARFKKVTVFLDTDAVSQASALARRLVLHVPEVRLARLPRSKDPGEALTAEVQEALSTAKKVAATP